MFDPVTKKIHVSRDIRWLDRMYYVSKDESKVKKVNKNNALPVDIMDPIDGDPISSQKKKVTIAPTPTPAISNDESDNGSEVSVDEAIDYESHPDDDDKGEWLTTTRSGRHVYQPKYGEETS